MIDPSNITKYDRTDAELEEFILFWVCAAGKNGTTTARLLEEFLKNTYGPNVSPFATIRWYASWPTFLTMTLKRHGIGCYTHKARTMSELANSGINLRTCTAEDLEEIYGIGMKTSRCFLLHSREDAQCAGLDTHMLKHLKANGVGEVPKVTPSSKKVYKRLELEVLRLSKEAGMSPANYDLSVWNSYAVK